MATVSLETLVKVRGKLVSCLDLLHDEANAGAKKEVIHAIAILDDIIGSEVKTVSANTIYPLIAKVIAKLPWIISVMRDLE